MAQTRFAQHGRITSSIVVVEEARRAIVAALHDVLRDMGDVGTRQASHSRIIGDSALRAIRIRQRRPVRNSRLRTCDKAL